MLSNHLINIRAQAMSTIADILSRLPLDLLLSVVELSDCPTTTYIQLLGLTHAVRAVIFGTARDLSFRCRPDEGEFPWPPPPAVPLDALAALVRPCKGPLRLSLVGQNIPLLETGNEFECAAWVMQTFVGHPPALTALRVPMGPLVLALMRGGHLGGLEELRLDPGDYPILGRVLTALGRGVCPRLQSLQIMGFQPGGSIDWAAALGPLAGTLRELVLPEIWHPARLAACFQMARSPVLERVSLAALAACGGVGAAVGANLTHLTLHLESDLVGMVGLCRRLVSLDLPIECPGLAALLAANEPTLRDLTLRGPSILWATALPDCPPMPGGAPSAVPNPLLPPALLDRLDRLALLSSGGLLLHSVYIASSRLRQLDMEKLYLCVPGSLCLLCPALEKLAIPMTAPPSQYCLRMDCPRLRSFRCPEMLLQEPFGVRFWMTSVLQPLVLAGAARLTELSGIPFDQPEALSLMHSLRRLTLPLPKSIGVPLVLRLPPQVEQLTVALYPGSAPSRLEVDGPGLRAVTVRGSHYIQSPCRVALRCPALTALRLAGDEIMSFEMLNVDAPPLLLRCLSIDCCRSLGEASLLACLTRHGASLQQVTIRVGPAGWSQRVAGALEQLPRLARLILGEAGSDLTLACPRLRQLAVCLMSYSTRLMSLSLDCPLLEDLQAPFAALTRVELAGPPAGLRRIGGVTSQLVEERGLEFPAGVHFDPVGGRATEGLMYPW
ncbi:hypothetical protein PAPYR_6357 [Paratrimastix pyriformis]|uniref:Uncharacterized protein n=1 Tax=Paratrimastix pyriformis TaxID=342808 RepID=A0ABQ8UMH7_9EUKA|nr:hypothetical protein PAPYR_6357 [Paratrimastix pyriformis]